MTSVIIVSWNTREMTLFCIESVYQRLHQDFEIILVDNASEDLTVEAVRERFPGVQVIANEHNLGYARANNQAIGIARGDLLLLLNSDCRILSDDPDVEIDRYFSDHPECGVAGATLLLPDGRLQTGKRFFATPARIFLSQIMFIDACKRLNRLPSQQPYDSDYVDGAFLCARSEVFAQVGFFDPSYFMYAEDMEWCARARSAGWSIRVLPSVRVFHYHGQSAIQNYRHMLFHSAMNTCRFIRKRRGETAARLARFYYLTGMFLRIGLSLIRRNGLAIEYAQGLFLSIKRRKEFHAEF